MQRLLTFVLLACIVNTVHGFEPPTETVEQALKKGRVAFLARALAVKQLTRTESEVTAAVTLELVHCFYGSECKKGKKIDLVYPVQTIKDVTMPVQFPLATDIIFILEHPLRKSGRFDTAWPDGVDRAYICDAFPSSLPNFTGEFSCTNIYRHKASSSVTWDRLVRSAAQNQGTK